MVTLNPETGRVATIQVRICPSTKREKKLIQFPKFRQPSDLPTYAKMLYHIHVHYLSLVLVPDAFIPPHSPGTEASLLIDRVEDESDDVPITPFELPLELLHSLMLAYPVKHRIPHNSSDFLDPAGFRIPPMYLPPTVNVSLTWGNVNKTLTSFNGTLPKPDGCNPGVSSFSGYPWKRSKPMAVAMSLNAVDGFQRSRRSCG